MNDRMNDFRQGLMIPYRAKVCRAKVTNFLKSDENFARRIVSPDEKFRPTKNFTHQDFCAQVSSVLNGHYCIFERGIVKMTCLSI